MLVFLFFFVNRVFLFFLFYFVLFSLLIMRFLFFSFFCLFLLFVLLLFYYKPQVHNKRDNATDLDPRFENLLFGGHVHEVGCLLMDGQKPDGGMVRWMGWMVRWMGDGDGGWRWK